MALMLQLAALGLLVLEVDVAAGGPGIGAQVSKKIAAALLPLPPFRMWSFAYNTTTSGPVCSNVLGNPLADHCAPANKTTPSAMPIDALYPPHTYNLVNPDICWSSTKPLTSWLNQRGVACMVWGHCWNAKLNPNTNDSTAIAHFRNVIVAPATAGATSLGMDECADLTGPWGHLPNDIPGEKKMALAAEGFRQGKKLHPDLFVAAWNPGSNAEPDGVFGDLVKDGTINLAMFECYTHIPPYMISRGGGYHDGPISQWFPRFEYARKAGWLNRSIPCLGMMFGQSELNPTGWTQAELRATVVELKTRFPEMPGIGFYGSPPGNRSNPSATFVVDVHDTATLSLIAFASKLSKEIHPDYPEHVAP